MRYSHARIVADGLDDRQLTMTTEGKVWPFL